MIPSAGGWSAVKSLRKKMPAQNGDERILGDGDFVEAVLRKTQENLERKCALGAKGYDFNGLVKLLEITPKNVFMHGKYRQSVRARSLLCYWATQEFGMTTVELAKRPNMAQPTISQAAMRGRKIANDEGLRILDQVNQ